jgi:5-methylcytosine-specific restriction enzyme subunit McrC
VRGRIKLDAQLRRYGKLRHRHVCAYADLTADTAENKVILATLRYLPALLRAPGDRDLAWRVRYLARHFTGITAVSRKAALALLPFIRLHRLNESYGPVLSLCRLALNHLTLDERPGPHPFASFLVDMPRLFESFLTAKLRAALPEYGLRVVGQRYDYLDEDRTVGIRPDVLVYSRNGAKPLLVLDAKYRSLDEYGGDINRDLYQVSAYLDRYGLSQGVLVYPQFEGAASSRLKLRGTPKHIHVIPLDLSAPDPTQLERHCATLAERISTLARN